MREVGTSGWRKALGWNASGLLLGLVVAASLGCASGSQAEGSSGGVGGAPGTTSAHHGSTGSNTGSHHGATGTGGHGGNGGAGAGGSSSSTSSGGGGSGAGGGTSAGGGGAGGGDGGVGKDLLLCVLNQEGPADPCVIPANLDFGVVPSATSPMRLFRIENDTPIPAIFEAISIASTDFTTVTVRFDPDPANPGQFIRTVDPMPTARQPGESLFFEVTLKAGTTAGPLPADHATVTTQDGTNVIDTNVPFIGSIKGCDPGKASCDNDSTNGCETNIGTSLTDCGGCGQICNIPNASYACVAGVCTLGTCNPGWADCNGDPSDGCETNIATSLGNCGACGVKCDLPNASETCVNGVCTLGVCDPGYGNCDGNIPNGCETDIRTSLANCGSCGKTCDFTNASESCVNGFCTLGTCDPGFADCDNNPANGCEANTNTSLANCGGCGQVCNLPHATFSCDTGVCNLGLCSAGFADCNGDSTDGCETNLKSNLANCGTCGYVCDLPNASESCVNGACTLGTCDTGFANCNGNPVDGCEVDITTSLTNCGVCGKVCSFPNASATCSSGNCGLGACDDGFGNCDGNPANGCETNTDTSLANCGGCGNTCSFPHASTSCVAGACKLGACAPGFADCDGDPSNGCETDIKNSLSDCGGCGTVCDLANASETCVAGACTLGACDPGFANCDGNPNNGCEVDTASSLFNCGSCGKKCDFANASETCVNGLCTFGTCDVGFASCDGNLANGCETNTMTDNANCGTCGTACDFANASETCIDGSCQFTACNPGFADCDGNLGNGCEKNTNTDVNNCGGCGNVCSFPNGVAACVAGGCQLAGCTAGFGNCDGNTANGCETDIRTSQGNCGGCGVVCDLPNASESCVNGSCTLGVCDAGFRNCDGNPANGCETNTDSDKANCGGCSQTCDLANASESCVAGSCILGACDPGFLNCTAANGCETNGQTDVNNCGSCNNKCSTTYPNSNVSCTSGTCNFLSCLTGHYDLDGNLANGCEYACTFQSATDTPDDSFVDANCDGIDGDVTKAIFVATNGLDSNTGLDQAHPVLHVQTGINKAVSAGRTQVYISNGTYTEQVTLANGVSLYGGYSAAAGWARSAAYVATIQYGTVSGGRIIAVQGTNITTATTIDRVTIRSLDAPATASISNYGMYCNNCTGVTLKNSIVDSGAASAGTSGGNGSAGTAGANGSGGNPGSCDGANGSGGIGGARTCGSTVVNGGGGGNGGAEGSNNGSAGGTGSNGGGVGGGGGGACNCGFICGGCSGSPGGNGTGGSAATVGGSGAGGTGAGTLSGTYWVGIDGGAGAGGNHGKGGGGGGGGGGQGGTDVDDGGGNGGGGGGSGGCGGTGAFAGTAGGGSFGLFLYNSPGFVLTNTSVQSSSGGAGGSGGTGGNGGTHGNGAGGAATCTGEVGAGGSGANGSDGARGGHGGGGAGGVSYGVYRAGTTNIVLPGTNALTHGSGGVGGTSPAGGGSNGSAGNAGNYI